MDQPTPSPAGPRPRVAADPLPLLGFFTRIPIGTRAPLEAVVAAFPLVPLVGWVVGVVAAVVAVVLAPWVPPLPLACLLLAVVVGLTGLNQMDGLLDMGDGLMVHGDAERRLRVMHDHSAGVGAVGAVLITYLLTFASLAALAGQRRAVLAAALVTAEVLARVPYLLLAWWGRPSHEGLGRAFIERFGLAHAAAGAVVALPVLAAAVWLGAASLAGAVLAAVLVAALLARISARLFGGVGGDVMGASQEVARALILLVLTVGLT